MKNIFNTFILQFASSQICSDNLRVSLYRYLGAEIEDGAIIRSNCFFSDASKMSHLKIGRNSFVNTGCYFDLSAEVFIGENVAIAPYVNFVTSTHKLGSGDSVKRVRDCVVRGSVIVANGCWVGFGSTLLAGCRIGLGVVLGANSLVLEGQWCRENLLYVGTPATTKAELKQHR